MPYVDLLVYNSVESDQIVCQVLTSATFDQKLELLLYRDVCLGSPNLHRRFLTNKNIWDLFTENRDGVPMTGRGYILGIHYMAKSKFSTIAGITSVSLIKLRDA